MAIAGYKPTVDPVTTSPNLPTTEPDNYKSIIYDDKYQPLHNLIAYVSGSPWEVDYYGQVLSEHNDLRELDIGQSNVLQQYYNIKGLELRVESPLDNSYDADTGITTVIGSSITYPFMTPNVSDYFVTNVGDNRKGLFRIVSVERKTHNRDSVYSIGYAMVGYIEVLTAMYAELQDKVTHTYHFSKDRLIEGLQPILKSEDYELVSNLSVQFKNLVRRYFRTFFNRKYSTLILPGQEYPIYDSYLLDYLLKIVESTDASEIRHIRKLPIDQDPYLTQPQFWTLMLEKDPSMIDEVNEKMSMVSKELFNNNSYLHELRYSNIDYIVYPSDADTTTRLTTAIEPKTVSTSPEIIEIVNHAGTLADLLVGTITNTNVTIPVIKLVTEDDSYVLTNIFYTEGASLSLLEQLTLDYIKSQPIDLSKLNVLLNAYETWGRLEQFYYGPILMTLIKQSDRDTYS